MTRGGSCHAGKGVYKELSAQEQAALGAQWHTLLDTLASSGISIAEWRKMGHITAEEAVALEQIKGKRDGGAIGGTI